MDCQPIFKGIEMNRVRTEDRVRVIASLVEGNSIRATVRMTGVSKNAIARLMAQLGPACERYQDRALRNLRKRPVSPSCA